MNLFAPRWQQLSSKCVFVCLLCISLSGCGQENWKARTYPVTGSVTINGAFPEGLFVKLLTLDSAPIDRRESVPWGKVESDGTFSIRTYDKGDGAPAGLYAVVLKWPADPTTIDTIDRLGGAYETSEKSPLQVTIEKKRNELPPIVLNDVKVLPKPKR